MIKKGGSHGARHGKSEAQREHHQAKLCLRKALKKQFDSILLRFQQCEACRNSQMSLGWDEDFSNVLTELHEKTIHTSPLGMKDEGMKMGRK